MQLCNWHQVDVSLVPKLCPAFHLLHYIVRTWGEPENEARWTSGRSGWKQWTTYCVHVLVSMHH